MNKKFGVLLILLVFVFSSQLFPQSDKKQIIKKITSKEANKMIKNGKDNKDMIILDVRTPEEFKSGHIEGAQNIDFYSKNFEEELGKLDKNKKYLVYCRTGHRSGNSVSIMEKLGFTEVYDIGGINSWIKEGFKTVK